MPSTGSISSHITKDFLKPEPPPKRRTRAASSNSNVPSRIPSEPINVRPRGRATSAVQPIDVDALPDDTEEDPQHQANRWAALIRNVVKGKSTRQRKPEALLRALCDASAANLSSLVLARSGLYAAVRALAGMGRTRDMMAVLDAASELADEWEKQYGAGALEEEF